MAFGSFSEQNQPMADINTTPLVDVMLVLLVIFIITAPLFSEAVPIDLPQTSATQLDEKPSVLQVSLDAQGSLTFNGDPIAFETLEQRCRDAVSGKRDTELHLRADKGTRYERVAEVMASIQRAGVERIAFVTDPPRNTTSR